MMTDLNNSLQSSMSKVTMHMYILALRLYFMIFSVRCVKSGFNNNTALQPAKPEYQWNVCFLPFALRNRWTTPLSYFDVWFRNLTGLLTMKENCFLTGQRKKSSNTLTWMTNENYFKYTILHCVLVYNILLPLLMIGCLFL